MNIIPVPIILKNNMKIQIQDKLIKITPSPKRNKKNGIKMYCWRNPTEQRKYMPIISTDVKKGKDKYDLPILDGFKFLLRSIEF